MDKHVEQFLRVLARAIARQWIVDHQACIPNPRCRKLTSSKGNKRAEGKKNRR
jgi:hypothetical protein